MSATSNTAAPMCRYHTDAYRFIFEALHHTQKKLDRTHRNNPDDESAHISGKELLEGIRELALKEFGLLAKTVFASWGVRETADFGKMVFEMVERGEMRKTDRDRLSDFSDVYSFNEALDTQYEIQIDR